jgi:intracellular septation protein
MNSLVKLGLEIGPLMGFFAVYHTFKDQGEITAITYATILFMVTIVFSLGITWYMTKTVSKMAALTAVVVLVFGGLTIYLQDEVFTQLKPTIINSAFALALGFGLLRGKSYLQALMPQQAMPLTNKGWMIMTWMWTFFFIGMAILNEFVRATQTFDKWLEIRTFYYLPITIVFTIAMLPILKNHMVDEE